MSETNYLQVEKHDAVALVRFNRPEVLNALCTGLMEEMAEVFTGFEADDSIAGDRADRKRQGFRRRADISEMRRSDYQYMLRTAV